ncbi:MAG: sulfur carrier protein ThiS adenylyltransferase ThiF [Candidatus Omnitrophota bacterium]
MEMKMNAFEESLAAQLGVEGFRKVQAVKIGIAGAGGLGSNCAFNLVRSGFKRFKIVDFDVVDHSNLNRQFYFYDQVGMSKVEALEANLRRINPDIEVETVVDKIDGDNVGELFADSDIVVEALDWAESKSMLVAGLLKTGKLLVSASGLAGIGDTDGITVHRVRENLVIVGDLTSDSRDMPPVSPRVNIAAAKQADVILDYVVNH